MLNKVKFLFFGNYFYGICAVSLSIEASLQQGLIINTALYYIILFLGTVLFYTYAYAHINEPNSNNIRTRWYSKHFNSIKIRQIIRVVLIIIFSIYYINEKISIPYFFHFLENKKSLLVFITFPITGLLYYGISSTGLSKYNIRSIGWLKPILIGFTWAGIVTIYPSIFSSAEQQNIFSLNTIHYLLFIKNMMFITVLCIMFDIKDYASDYNKSLKTFVVHFGLRNTIFYILIPLSALGLSTFLVYGASHHFSILKLIINTLPFILLIQTAYSMKARKSIFYYLIVIDGLMLVKAICGSLAMIYF